MEFRCPGSCGRATPCFVPDSLAGCSIGCPHSGETITVPLAPFTEMDWQTLTEPRQLLLGLPTTVSVRKQRLFALGCCQRVASKLTHRLSQQALVLMERCAEGLSSDEDLRGIIRGLTDEYNARLSSAERDWNAVDSADLDAAYSLVIGTFPIGAAYNALRTAADQAKERVAQRHLIHCVFGNPFHPVTIDSSWLTWNDGTVPKLAQTIYDERAFENLPILADALEDAGCTNKDILDHCRAIGPHARGCWVVDLILAR